jgi:hypothetical protein
MALDADRLDDFDARCQTGSTSSRPPRSVSVFVSNAVAA